MTLTQIKRAGLDGEALDHVFTIGASGTDHYTFQGEGLNGTVNDPTLYLTRGKTYRFENGTGAHAIRIQSADNGTSGTLYNTGVTNNNTTGTVIVEVQHDAPDVLYYQCASHANMKGTIYITGALADGGVSTAKLANSAVTSAKLADNSVSTDRIVDGAVNANKLGSAVVTTAKIANSAVTNSKLGDDCVTGSRIADDAVANEHIAANAVDTAQLATNSVTTLKLVDDAVTDVKINGMAASKLTGALPAISGANLTNLPGGGKVTRVFQVTGGTHYQGSSWGDYITLTITNVTSDKRYLVFVSFNHQVQMTDYLAYSAFSTTHASPVGENFNLSIGQNSGTSVRRNGFIFDTASSTNNRTYKLEHRSGSGQSNRRSILSSGVIVALELDFS